MITNTRYVGTPFSRCRDITVSRVSCKLSPRPSLFDIYLASYCIEKRSDIYLASYCIEKRSYRIHLTSLADDVSKKRKVDSQTLCVYMPI